jgi:hypothetical protein
MRLLRKFLSPARCRAVSHTKTAFLSNSEPFLTLLKTPYNFKNCMVVRLQKLFFDTKIIFHFWQADHHTIFKIVWCL